MQLALTPSYFFSSGALSSGPGGRRFKSSLPDQFISSEYEHCNYQSGGLVVDGNLRPSSDLATHLELYKHFPSVGGVAHTHSEFATARAQARCTIRCFGTTHADSFHGRVPVTEDLTPAKIESDYEKNTGFAICRLFKTANVPNIRAALVAGHAPFCWAANAMEAAHTAVILQYLAKIVLYTVVMAPSSQPISRELHDKHYFA